MEGIKQFSGKCVAVGFAMGLLVAAVITVGTLAYAISIGVPLISN